MRNNNSFNWNCAKKHTGLLYYIMPINISRKVLICMYSVVINGENHDHSTCVWRGEHIMTFVHTRSILRAKIKIFTEPHFSMTDSVVHVTVPN